eukprot:scaffold4796_cov264-Amphora_coffeaeformis.AAC.4
MLKSWIFWQKSKWNSVTTTRLITRCKAFITFLSTKQRPSVVFQATMSDGRTVEGIVQDKERARATYQTAVQMGRQANLMEQVRRDVFTMRIGNLPAGGKVVIALTYLTTLQARQEDGAALVLPTTIAPRYTPPSYDQHTLTALEAQAMAPPSNSTFSTTTKDYYFVPLYGLDIDVQIKCHSPIRSITSPTHPHSVVTNNNNTKKTTTCMGDKPYNDDPKTGHVSLHNSIMDRDVVLLIQEQDLHQPRAILEVSDDNTHSATVMTGLVTFYPQLEFPDHRDGEFIFVVDQSGSMSGAKMAQAREALLLLLRALPSGCRFNIVGFGSHFQALFARGSRPYNDDTLQTASKYASSMSANMGGTELLKPLQKILGQPRTRSGSTRQVFVLTDGEVSNDTAVFDLIRRHSTWARLFSIGIGSSASRHLVSSMARAGRGTARFVADIDGGTKGSLRSQLLGQLKQALQPSLEDVTIEWKFPEAKKMSLPHKPTRSRPFSATAARPSSVTAAPQWTK